jgi:hypothetical protein
MQVAFFRQHFGEFALGMTNTDRALKVLRLLLVTESQATKSRFFSVTSGGVSNPWQMQQRDRSEIRIAIVGDGLICDQERTSRCRLYGKAEFNGQEFYLEYSRPNRIVSAGLPDPKKIYEDAFQAVTLRHCTDRQWPEWVVVDKAKVPRKFRSLLGQIQKRIGDSTGQGPAFFRGIHFR